MRYLIKEIFRKNWIFKGSAATAIIFLMLLSPFNLFAAVITHTVKEGESLTGIAKKYYGSDDRYIILGEYNNLPNPKKIDVGQKIVIPKSFKYRIKKGDQIALIAKRFLDNKDRYAVLMEINGIKDPKNISIDQIIKIPAKIPYTVKKGETLAIIAERFYGDIKKYTLIASYNFISDPKMLEPGQRLVIPIPDLEVIEDKKPKEKKVIETKVIEAKKDLTAKAPEKAPPKTEAVSAEGQKILKKGIDDYFKGSYDEAISEINMAVEKGLSQKEDMLKAYRFLAYAHVARDENEEAKKAFTRALELDPKMELDPVYVSPKIIEVFKDVKGEQ